MERLFHRPKPRKGGDESIHEHREALSDHAEETGTTRVNSVNSHSDLSKSNKVKASNLTSPPAMISSPRERPPPPPSDHGQSTDLPSIDTREQTIDSASPRAREGNVTSKDYWRLAIEEMQKEDPAARDQIAGVQQAAAESGDRDFVAQLLHTTKERQQALEAKRWKVPTRSGDWVLREKLDRILKVVTVVKDMGSAAATLDPVHAGLPMAGFCVLMQVWQWLLMVLHSWCADMETDGYERCRAICGYGGWGGRDRSDGGTISTSGRVVSPRGAGGAAARVRAVSDQTVQKDCAIPDFGGVLLPA
jgi:hypothetical protein